MPNQQLYRRKLYKTKGAKSILFFICPFGTKFWVVSRVIKKLQRKGYEVVAYDTTNDVFYAANPKVLVDIVNQIVIDIKKSIRTFQKSGIKDFGFFGSSLGAFIAYNCVSRIPELRWGVFNTGGNIAEAMWRIRKPRRRHLKSGLSLEQVIKAWRHLQYPKFSGLAGNSYLFLSSPSDEIAPIEDIEQYMVPIRNAGAKVELKSVLAFGHVSTAIVGFIKAVQLLESSKQSVK